MNVMLFGASGMVGQGVLRELLSDPAITQVLSIGRTDLQQQSEKLRQIIRPDLFALDDLEAEFRAADACIFTLGVSSFRMKEPAYRRITFDLTLSVANRFVALNPNIAFLYVSGQSTDSSGQGKVMWARVKGQTENALLALPFRAAYMFRPGGIVPLHGIRSKTPLYNAVYVLLGPILPWLARRFPKHITTTEKLGQAMLKVLPTPGRAVLETTDIDRLASQ